MVRLFPEFRKAEEHYFAETGLFPIMRLIGIRRELAQKHPWLAMMSTRRWRSPGSRLRGAEAGRHHARRPFLAGR